YPEAPEYPTKMPPARPPVPARPPTRPPGLPPVRRPTRPPVRPPFPMGPPRGLEIDVKPIKITLQPSYGGQVQQIGMRPAGRPSKVDLPSIYSNRNVAVRGLIRDDKNPSDLHQSY